MDKAIPPPPLSACLACYGTDFHTVLLQNSVDTAPQVIKYSIFQPLSLLCYIRGMYQKLLTTCMK